MSAPVTERPAAPSDRAATAVPVFGVAGARDSGAAALEEHLRTSGGCRIAQPSGQDELPDAVVVAVDALCPVRPDDVTVAARLAARVPVAVVLTGTADAGPWWHHREETDRRLAAAGLAPALAWVPRPRAAAADRADVATGDLAAGLTGAELIAAIGARARRADGSPGTGDGGGQTPAENPAAEDGALQDWLGLKRTEAITHRSAALRRHTQSARLELGAEIARRLRPIAADGKTELLAARRRDLPGLVEQLDTRADAAAAELLSRAAGHAVALRRRHLLEAGRPDLPRAPRLGLEFGHPPRHRGEELVLVGMGAAAGTGVGRLVATPFAGNIAVLAVIVCVTLAAGCLLGLASVRARRTAALRHHLISSLGEHCASLRAELELVVTAVLLDAESAITDAFAHDPGPRVLELDRRIRRRRSAAAVAASSGNQERS